MKHFLTISTQAEKKIINISFKLEFKYKWKFHFTTHHNELQKKNMKEENILSLIWDYTFIGPEGKIPNEMSKFQKFLCL